MLQSMTSPASGGYGDLGQVLAQLFEKMAREEPDAFARLAQARRAGQREAYGRGDAAGLSDAQAAAVNQAQTPFERSQMLASVGSVNRQRMVKSLGHNPGGGHVSPMQPGETIDDYKARLDRSKSEQDAKAQKNRDASEARKRELAKAGKVGKGYVVTGGGKGEPYKATVMAGKLKADAGTFDTPEAGASAARKKLQELIAANMMAGLGGMV